MHKTRLDQLIAINNVKDPEERIEQLEELLLDETFTNAIKQSDTLKGAYKKAYQDSLQSITAEYRNYSAYVFKNVLEKPEDFISKPISHPLYAEAQTAVTENIIENILSKDNTRIQALAIERWIGIMQASFESGDFFTATAIYNGLNSANVGRLTAAKNSLSVDAKAAMTAMEEFGYSRGIRAYAVMSAHGGQLIPFFGGYQNVMTMEAEKVKAGRKIRDAKEKSLKEMITALDNLMGSVEKVDGLEIKSQIANYNRLHSDFMRLQASYKESPRESLRLEIEAQEEKLLETGINIAIEVARSTEFKIDELIKLYEDYKNHLEAHKKQNSKLDTLYQEIKTLQGKTSPPGILSKKQQSMMISGIETLYTNIYLERLKAEWELQEAQLSTQRAGLSNNEITRIRLIESNKNEAEKKVKEAKKDSSIDQATIDSLEKELEKHNSIFQEEINKLNTDAKIAYNTIKATEANLANMLASTNKKLSELREKTTQLKIKIDHERVTHKAQAIAITSITREKAISQIINSTTSEVSAALKNMTGSDDKKVSELDAWFMSDECSLNKKLDRIFPLYNQYMAMHPELDKNTIMQSAILADAKNHLKDKIIQKNQEAVIALKATLVELLTHIGIERNAARKQINDIEIAISQEVSRTTGAPIPPDLIAKTADLIIDEQNNYTSLIKAPILASIAETIGTFQGLIPKRDGTEETNKIITTIQSIIDSAKQIISSNKHQPLEKIDLLKK